MADDELSEFLARADMVQRQVNALASGEISPDEVKLPGQDNWAYQDAAAKRSAKASEKTNAEKEERTNALILHKRWDAQRAARLALEERDRWWKFARMQYGEHGVNAQIASQETPSIPRSSSLPENRWRPGSKGPIDYSWWEKYAVNPDDEVTVAEAKRLEEEEERRQNEAFEKANPGFCMSFKKDELERDAANRAKAARSEALKEEGNAFFKKGDIPGALGRYHDALRLTPFNAAVLNNIANSHITSEDWENCIEFCSRVLHIELANGTAGVKALYRRGTAKMHKAEYGEAYEDLALAARNDPGNAQVAASLLAARNALEEAGRESGLNAGKGIGISQGLGEAGQQHSQGPPPAPLTLAQDGLPSPAAISASIALVDTPFPQLLEIAKARLSAVYTSPPSSSFSPQHNAELRALSRELRACASSLAGQSGGNVPEEWRVLVRTCGLLPAASTAFVNIVGRVLVSAKSNSNDSSKSTEEDVEGAESTSLSTMAVLASLAMLFTAAIPNIRNRTLLRTPSAEGVVLALAGTTYEAPTLDTALGSALALLGTQDESLVKGFSLSCAHGGSSSRVGVWLYQLLHPLALFAEAYSKPAATDPMGRAALASHAYIAAGGITRRLAASLEVVKAGVGDEADGKRADLRVGALETLHATASTLQFLAAFDQSAALLSAVVPGFAPGEPAQQQQPQHPTPEGKGKSQIRRPPSNAPAASPFAPMVEAVVKSVDGLASGGGGVLSERASEEGHPVANPMPALIQAVVVLCAMGVVDEASLHSPAMLACVGAVANLCAHAPYVAAIHRAIVGAEKLPSTKGSPANFPLLPLLHLFRLPFQPSTAASGASWIIIRATAVAALANSLAPALPSVPIACEALASTPHAIQSLLTVLREGPGGGRSVLCCRVSLLLGRLSGAPSGETALQGVKTASACVEVLRASLSRLQRMTQSQGSAEAVALATEEEEEAQIADGILRCLAVSVGSKETAASLLMAKSASPPLSTPSKTAVASGVIGTICAALENAQKTLVTGYPGKRVRGIGMGNGLKALIGLCEVEGCEDAMLAEGACDAFTAALLCPGKDSDPASSTVRKNAAVGVAKLARHPPCHERLKAGRALEVIMQLRDLF